MAIAHIATEYVFSDFLLKEPPETRYKGLRLELALDKIVTCIAVGLPLLLISLAFAQEVSIGNCGSPPFPVPGASRGGQRARRGGGRRSGARAGRQRSVGLGCREGSRWGQGRAGQRGPLGRGKESCLPRKQPSRRASLAAASSRCAGLPGRPSPPLAVPSSSLGHSLASAVLSAPPEQEPCRPSRLIFFRASDGGALKPFVSRHSSDWSSLPGCTPGPARLLPLPALGVFGSRVSVSLGSCQGQVPRRRSCQSSAFALQAARGGSPPGPAVGSSLKLSAAPLPSCSSSRSVFNFCCDSVGEIMLYR